MKRWHLLLFIAIGCIAFAPRAASAGGRAKQVKYIGVHPIPRVAGGGICHIEAPHVHIYGPDVKLNYRDHRGYNHFVGDPVAYGWDGPRYSYYGHHPVDVDVVVGDEDDGEDDVEYCYLNGPHFHYYAPAPVLTADFKVQGDVYWYVGKPSPVYVDARPELVRVNAVYTPLVYARPVVEVTTPPPGWIGATIEVSAPAVVVGAPPPVVVERPHVHGAVGVGVSAGVEVHVPTPSLSVQIGGPAVVVGARPAVVHEREVIVVDRKHGKHKHRGWGRGKGRW